MPAEAAPHPDSKDGPGATRRATVGESPAGELSPNTAAAGSGTGSGRTRRKSITTACERCRRRKIRCDGNQPCATCARFSVACVRPSKHRERFGPEAQAALEDRVRRLEAQLAETRKYANMDPVDETLGQWPGDEGNLSSGYPALKLETAFGYPQRSYSFDDELGAPYSATSLTSPDIPMIEITGCETPLSRPLSPSPSLLSTSPTSATSRASTPDPYAVTTPAFGSHLTAPSAGPSVSPPISPHNSSNAWEYGSHDEMSAFLSPATGTGDSISRRSSISSLGLDDFGSMNLTFPEYQDISYDPSAGTFTPNLHYSPPQMPTSTPYAQTAPQAIMPSRLQAEQLAEFFFSSLEPQEHVLDRSKFQTCLDAVYALPDFNSPMSVSTGPLLKSTTYSFSIAKFQVFLVLAAALLMLGDAPDSPNAVVAESLYRLAMHQTLSSRFWSEPGGRDMAHLLAVFAGARRETR